MMLTDDDIMPFGKYFKKKLRDVPDDYLMWLFDQEWCERQYPDVFDYIKRNLKAIDQGKDEEDE